MCAHRFYKIGCLCCTLISTLINSQLHRLQHVDMFRKGALEARRATERGGELHLYIYIYIQYIYIYICVYICIIISIIIIISSSSVYIYIHMYVYIYIYIYTYNSLFVCLFLCFKARVCLQTPVSCDLL